MWVLIRKETYFIYEKEYLHIEKLQCELWVSQEDTYHWNLNPWFTLQSNIQTKSDFLGVVPELFPRCLPISLALIKYTRHCGVLMKRMGTEHTIVPPSYGGRSCLWGLVTSVQNTRSERIRCILTVGELSYRIRVSRYTVEMFPDGWSRYWVLTE